MQLGVYRHYRGGYYQVIGVALDSTNWVGGPRRLVIYVGLTEKAGPRMFARELDEFCGTVRVASLETSRFRFVGDEIPKEPP